MARGRFVCHHKARVSGSVAFSLARGRFVCHHKAGVSSLVAFSLARGRFVCHHLKKARVPGLVVLFQA